MGLTYLIGIVVAALSAVRRAPGFGAPPPGSAMPRSTVPLVALLAAALVASFAFSAAALDAAAAAQAMPAWQRALPLAMFTRNGLYGVADPARLGGVVEAVAFAQTLLLVGLWAVLRRVPRPTPALAGIAIVAACGLAWIALHAHVAGPDLYAYAGFALAAHPYHPGPVAFPGDDAAISAIWGVPLVPSPYGPAWNGFSHLLLAHVTGLGAQLALLRGVGLAGMAASIAALAIARRPIAATLLALDPALWQAYVSEGHNDVAGIALLLIALACRRRSIVLAIACVACAGAVKLPLLAVGLAVLATAPALRARLLACAAATAACFAAYAACGGADYLGALRRTADIYPRVVPPGEWAAHALLAAVAVGAIAAAVLARRHLWGAPWSFAACGPYTAWQYLGWGIPYALLDETNGALYLALFPLTALDATLIFNGAPFFDAWRTALLGVLVAALVLALRRPAARAGRTTLEPATP